MFTFARHSKSVDGVSMAHVISCESLFSPLFLLLWSLFSFLTIESSSLAEPSYARVSINRAQSVSLTGRNSSNRQSVGEGRSFARSPIYVPASTNGLRKGEAIDYRENSATDKYTTIDREALARLDRSKTRAQDRFHPPANFEHLMREKNEFSTNSQPEKAKFPVPSYATLPKELYSPSYDYQPGESPPASDDAPSLGNGDSPDSGDDSFSKIPDSYGKPEIYGLEDTKDSPKFSEYASTYVDGYQTKPIDERPSYADSPFFSAHDYNHEPIYDQPPEDHYHYDHPKVTSTTTEEPEMNDQRLSKRPYSYYYIGKKLWYIPLYFSIYFIIYIAALVLKSITRHKINFPASLAAVAANAGRSNAPYVTADWYDLTRRVLDAIDLYNSVGSSGVP